MAHAVRTVNVYNPRLLSHKKRFHANFFKYKYKTLTLFDYNKLLTNINKRETNHLLSRDRATETRERESEREKYAYTYIHEHTHTQKHSRHSIHKDYLNINIQPF